jgi:PAS domain S-box-containing protein
MNVRSKYIKGGVIGLTVALLILGYSLIVKAGVSDVRDVFSFLVASYLLVWGGYALASTIPQEEIRSQFVLTTLSFVVALLLMESPAWLQLIDYRETFAISSNLPWERPGYEPDRELIYKPKPHYAAKIQFDHGNIGRVLCLPPHPAEVFELKYDKNGFRNEEDLKNADVAVIGDSYVESPMIPASQLASTGLAQLTKMTVANLGHSGYGPQQELAVLKRYGLPLHPKTVVWMFYEGNDLLDARGYADTLALLQSRWESLDSAWDRSFTRNSLLWLTQSVQGCIPNSHEMPQAARTTVVDTEGKENKLYIKGHSYSVTLTKQELDDLQKVVTVLKEAYQLVREDGARFMVVFVPHAYRVYRDILNFEGVGGDVAQWGLNDLPDRLRSLVGDLSPEIDYADLTPALRAAARRNVLVYLPDDTHWATQGHQVVAEVLANALTMEPKRHVETPALQQPPNRGTVLSADAILVRNLDGTIRYWSKGAQKLYGWGSQEVLGASSHLLLKTKFPIPLEVIEEELRVKGHWDGQLIHQRRDGSTVTVASHWDLQRNPYSEDRSVTIVEINGPSES